MAGKWRGLLTNFERSYLRYYWEFQEKELDSLAQIREKFGRQLTLENATPEVCPFGSYHSSHGFMSLFDQDSAPQH